jgi:hypothetical protein
MLQAEPTPGMTNIYQPRHPALRWIERRVPIGRLFHAEFVTYPTPRNLGSRGYGCRAKYRRQHHYR